MRSEIDSNTFCIAAKKQPCGIFMQLPIWNEFLLQAGLQLREVWSIRKVGIVAVFLDENNSELMADTLKSMKTT